MVCDKVVCERWCVTKLIKVVCCVEDGVCDKVLWERRVEEAEEEERRRNREVQI